MLTRRDWIRTTAAAGAAVSLSPRMLGALGTQDLITRAVPSSGEQLPIIGLGSSATFRRVAGSDDVAALGEVLKTFTDNGATVFDTAPSYGASEEVSGHLAAEMGITDQIFWATKVNVAGRGGGSADPDRARAQIERSFGYFGVDVMDLIQVHNLGDPPVQVGILQELKAEGRIRYLGITSTSKRQYPALAQAMQDYPLDFIGIDYAANNTSAADDIFPIAQDQGIGILVYVPFGRNLFTRASGQEVPEWAAEFGATTWAQFFLKLSDAHPAVTCVTPATSQARHMLDNIGAARGRLPDEDEQARMLEVVEALPPAPRRRG